MKSTMKKFTVLALSAIMAVSGIAMLASCSEEEVNEKTIAYTSSVNHMDYVDLGGYGSDFTMFDYAEITLYDNDTYVLRTNYVNYAGAWNIVASENDVTVYGTYTVVFEDNYGMKVDLSAATRVVSRTVITSTITYQDTDDLTTFTATEEKTAEALRDELLAANGAITGVEIDTTTHGLTMPSEE